MSELALLRAQSQGIGPLISYPCSFDIRPIAEGQVEREVISIMTACELVEVSRRTIYNWLSSGKLEYVRTAGGSICIFVDMLWRSPYSNNRPAVNAIHTEDPKPA
jgi:excisionase family DNA binding protein